MMSGDRCSPFYQVVDGVKLPGSFSPEVFRSGLHYKAKAGDLFISTFPKCGTTWTEQIVCLIYNNGQPFDNFREMKRRTAFLELVGVEGVDVMLKPGLLKVHVPYELTPMSPEAKYIYVVRNPKDTLVSFYHHTCSIVYLYEDGDFNDFYEIFLKGENDFGDYFDHVLGWYEHRNDPNVLFLTYEELKRDTKNTVKKIGHFMGDQYGKKLEEDETLLKKVIKYSSFEYMKEVYGDSATDKSAKSDFTVGDMPPRVKDGESGEGEHGSGKLPPEMGNLPTGMKHVYKFIAQHSKSKLKQFDVMRKGIIGDWRNNFSEDQASRMDAKIEEKLKGTDLYTYWKSSGCI